MSVASAKTAQDIKQKPRTGDVLIEENLDFRGLLLSESVQQGLTKSGFERPSPIQLKAIPLGRCGLDLIVQAKSGTGKTCVFAVIALEGIMLESMATQVLVLAPTREIAVQISDVINDIGSCMPGLRCLTFIGGTPLHEDRQKLARCHIAVGTPGRIKQLIEENALSTSNIRLFVLDEADKLLENSFQDQINWIYSALSENKQMLALSATYPEVLAQHLTAYMRNPTFLRLNATDPALLGIRQYYRTVKFHPLPNKLFDNKTDALIELLSSVDFHQCLVFSNYQMRAQSLSEVLNFRGWPATYISGSREQQERMAAMASLKQMTCRVLISTDLTSRGIDAENVNLVVNLDVPPSHETYLHRIGRAGRFGTYGAGVTFVAEGKEMDELRRLETDCNTEIKPLPDPVPKDLAHSSGYVSLDHLVTTETIVTDKGKIQPRLVESAEKVKTGDKSRLEGKSEALDLNPEATSVKSNGKVKSYGPRSKGYGPRSMAKVNARESPQAIQEDNSTPPASELEKSNGPQSSEIGQVKNGEKISCSSTGSTNGAAASENCPSTEATSSEQDNVETKSPVKPKWKKNNIWTSMSFNYTEEWNELDEKREREEAAARAAARSERRPDNARRRRQGPSGPRGTTDRGGSEDKSKIPTPQLHNGASKVVPPIPDRKDGRKEVPETSKDVVGEVCKVQQSCLTQSASESPSSARGKNLEIPSLIEIRGESVSPRTFADISQDYEKYTSADVPEKENAPPVTLHAKQDSNVERYTQYLEDVSKFLQRDSQKEITSYNAQKKSFEERNSKISTVVEEESEKQTNPSSKIEKSPRHQQSGTVTSETAPQDDDKKILKEKPKATQTNVKSNSKELVTEKSSCRVSSETGVSKNPGLCPPKEGTNNLPSAVESLKEGKLQKSNKALFNGKGVKKTGKTAEEMLLSYQTINDNPSYSESDQSIPTGIGKEQSDTEASSPITSGSSSRPSKPRRRVDPYGPWSPYVAPEPLLPESSNITDDEASEEGLSDEGSEWESSDLDCVDGEESEGGPHSGRQSSSKPPKPGHGGCTLPTEYLTAHHNMWMAQQQMQFTTACYQNYMMHLQYAEYYKKLLKNQQRQWKMEDFYLTQKKYIKQMAKWMSQNYQS